MIPPKEIHCLLPHDRTFIQTLLDAILVVLPSLLCFVYKGVDFLLLYALLNPFVLT